ncbi:alpha-amylase family glycosyl hydrolase [Cohnella laeviribosi]|uniref:alpha-amylase family glycosyl hydrolase n=1 Tax=Cohnella laeviribosi TaxID=380174 RepID=UPI003D1E73C4
MPQQVHDMKKQALVEKLEFLYGSRGLELADRIMEMVKKHTEGRERPAKPWVTERDVMLITYGDSIVADGQPPLAVLHEFLKQYVGDTVSAVHILPFYPYTSDDGFSVVDYRTVSPALGNWQHIRELSKDYDLMFDAVVNHISRSSKWFQGFLQDREPYNQYFIEADPSLDYSRVTRPRALPLLTKVETAAGEKYVWTTFSDDQIDINFANPNVLLEILDILLQYTAFGARFIRLDAIGFLWKKIGTTCMHLPETHTVVKVMREVLDMAAPGTILITETNVPHEDNISYFGNGYDEAQMVYQFPLPVLTLFSFLTGNAGKLMDWADRLERTSSGTTFFNFLASHDGIGMRPAEGILTEQEKKLLIDQTIAHGGKVSYRDNGDGTKTAYELNINYMDALTGPEESDDIRIRRFLAAHTILLSVVGVPGIYIHSLFGSRNDYAGLEASGINRRINREKLQRDKLENELKENPVRKEVFLRLCRLIQIRRTLKAFDPGALQRVVRLDDRVFAIERLNEATGDRLLVLVNVSSDAVEVSLPAQGVEVIRNRQVDSSLTLEPYEYMWISC